jgi:hypothetical protein
MFFIFYSPHLEKHSKELAQNFTDNLTAKDN